MVKIFNDYWEINNIEAVLFDKDGTFLNDNIYWGKLAENRIKSIIKYFNLNEDLLEELCFAIGYNPNTQKLIKNGPVGVMSRDEVVQFVVNELIKYGINTDKITISELFDDVHKDFLTHIENYVELLPYSKNFIESLKEHGVKLAVVTSDIREHTIKILEKLELKKYFDCVLGKDSCKNDKKSGEPALIALKKLGVTKEKTIVVGDALMDYLMAKNAGLRGAILVATGQTDIEDLKKCSKYVVNDLSEVKVKNVR